VLEAAGTIVQLELSGDPGAGGSARVWALVLDHNDVNGL
jgi:hypothetical protein